MEYPFCIQICRCVNPGPEVIKLFSYSTQLRTKFILLINVKMPTIVGVTMQNRWNNRISDGCVYAQICKGLGMHLVTYLNHDTVPFLLIVPIKGRFVRDGIHCVYIYQRLHDSLLFLNISEILCIFQYIKDGISHSC